MRHRRRGVKREHSVIGAFAAVFERLARLPGVAGVIPGRIASNPTRHPGLVLKAETATGFKLFAKTTTSIQEVFVVVRDGNRARARTALGAVVTRKPAGGAPGGPEARGGARRRARGGAGPGARAPRRPNPGILPAAPSRPELVRYEAAGRGGSGLREELDEATRRRLLVLRLRRSRWRRRFGVPVRRAPRGGRRRDGHHT